MGTIRKTSQQTKLPGPERKHDMVIKGSTYREVKGAVLNLYALNSKASKNEKKEHSGRADVT